MFTMARMSQPADIASRELRSLKMPWLTPSTAKTMATAPKTEIWKRCIEMESVARVYRTPRMRKS